MVDTMRDIDRDRDIFTKIWNAYKAYGNPTTDEEWEKLIEAMQEIYGEYESKLARDLINAVLSEVERDSR